MRMRVCARASACLLACVHGCVRACVGACVCVHLWYDGQPVPEVVQAYLGDVYAVDEDASLRRLDDPEQAVGEAGLAGSGPTDYTNLRTRGERCEAPHPSPYDQARGGLPSYLLCMQ